MKIIFLGDSLVEGNYGGNFVEQVAADLRNHIIINAGEGGNTVINLLNRLDAVLAQKPDGVFVMCGGNDALSYSQPGTRRYYEQVQKVPGGIVTPDVFARAYRELLTRIQLAYVQAWVGLEPMEYNRETFKAMQQYNVLARDEADALNIPVLNLMAALNPKQISERPPLDQGYINLIGRREREGWSDYEAERKRGGFTYSFDGIHLTPDSARRVADMTVEFLAEQNLHPR